jgi:hypothetical protein
VAKIFRRGFPAFIEEVEEVSILPVNVLEDGMLWQKLIVLNLKISQRPSKLPMR